MVDQPVVSAEEIAKQFDLSVSVVNFYTTLGLFEVHRRAGRGNKRFYLLPAVGQRLRMIREMKQRGFPLHLIQESLRRGQV